MLPLLAPLACGACPALAFGCVVTFCRRDRLAGLSPHVGTTTQQVAAHVGTTTQQVAAHVVALVVVRAAHFGFGMLLLLLFFVIRDDAAFVAVYAFMMASWLLLRGECAYNYVESRLEDASYRLGDDPGRQNRHAAMRALCVLAHSTFLACCFVSCVLLCTSSSTPMEQTKLV